MRHSFDDIGTGDKHVACVFDHDNKVGDRRAVDCATGTGAHNHTDLRDDARCHDIAVEDLGISSQAMDAFLDACATGVIQTDDGGTVCHCHVHDLADFHGMCPTDAPAKDGKVLRIDIDQPPIDCAIAGNDTISRDFLISQPKIVAIVGDKYIHLAKAAFIEQ